MESLTINVKDKELFEKIKWLLEHFKSEGVEIISSEDKKDLELLQKTRNEESISFEEYLKNENRD